MGDEKRRKKKARRMCVLCDAKFKNEAEQTAHYTTAFHKFMMGIKRTQMSYVGNAKTLNEQIAETGKKEPLIGLEYIYEYAEDSNSVRMYECKLCESAFKSNAIFFHVVGIQHRVLYLAKHHPIMGIGADYEVIQQAHYRKLANNALAIEQTHGRKKINVMNEVYVSKPNISEVSDSESVPEASTADPVKSAPKEGRKTRERLIKHFGAARFQQNFIDDDASSWQDEDELESQHDCVDMPRFLLQDEDFDARPMQRARSSVSQYDSRNDADVQGLDAECHPQSTYHSLGSVSQYDRKKDANVQGLDGDRPPQSMYHNLGSGPQYNRRDDGNVQGLGGDRPPQYMYHNLGSGPQYDRRDDGNVQGLGGDRPPQSMYHNLGSGSQYARRDNGNVQGLGVDHYPQSTYYSLGSVSQYDRRDDGNVQGLGGDRPPQSMYHSLGSGSQYDRRDNGNVQGLSGDRPPQSMYHSLGSGSQYDRRDNGNVQGLSGDRPPQSTYHNLGSGYQSENRDIPKFQQDTTGGMAHLYSTGGGTKTLPDARVGSLAPPGINSVPPHQQQERPFQQPADPLVGTTLKPVKPASSGGPISKDDFQDTDFRRVKSDRDRGDRSTRKGDYDNVRSHRKSSSSAGDSKDHSRRRKRSPEPRSRSRRHGSRSEGRGGDIDVRSVLPSGGISFRELRAAYDGRKLPEGFSSKNLPLFKKKKKQDKDCDSDMEVCSMEFSDCDPEEFWCNEELFDFLKTYYIGDEQDVQLLLEAIQLMSNALVRYKSRKEDLQKRILAEKQRLEEEKKAFSELKKRKEEKIAGTSSKTQVTAAEKANQPQQGTSSQPATASGTAPAVQKSQEKVNQPQQVTSSQKTSVSGIPPVGLPSLLGPLAAKVGQPQVSGLGLLLYQLFQRPQAAINVSQPQQVTSSLKAPVSGVGPLVQQAAQRPQGSETSFNQNPGSSFLNSYTSKEQAPFLGQGTVRYPAPQNLNQPPQQAAQAPETHFNQNQQFPAVRFDNSYPSKEQAPYLGQGAGRYSAPENLNQPQQPAAQRPQGTETRFNPIQNISASRFDNQNLTKDPGTVVGQGASRYSESSSRFNQNEQFPGSRIDNSGSLDKTKPPVGAGSETRFNTTPQISNLDPSKAPRPFIGQVAGRYSESDSRYNQNEQYPGYRMDNSGFLDKTKPPVGAGSGFSQTQGVTGSRFDHSGPTKEPTPVTGQGAGRYSGSGFSQTQGVTGSRFDHPGPSKEPTPVTGQGAGRYSGSDMRFSQTQGIPGSRFVNPGTSKEPTPVTGQGAGRYSELDNRYSQNEQYPGSRINNSGFPDKTKPPVAADQEAKYKQTQWNSGQQSGNQGFYNEARPTTGLGAGSYGEQYTQNQWQSQYNSRGALSETKSGFGSGMDRSFGPQSHQPTDSKGFSSDRQQGTWVNQDPSKAGTFPSSITDRARNIP